MHPFLVPAFRHAALAILLLLSGTSARAVAGVLDPVLGTLVTPEHAGLGAVVRMERSPYRDVGSRYDVMPLYLYESEHVYMHAYRAGLKLPPLGDLRADLFVAARLEGFPVDRIPASLQGMDPREPGADLGLGLQYPLLDGTLVAELRRDAGNASDGTELRTGYWEKLVSERWTLMPYVNLALRDGALNDYYFGVRPHEVRPDRPAYRAGRGLNVTLGLHAHYQFSEHWRAIGGIGVTRLSSAIRESPIAGNDSLLFAHVGVAYDFEPSRQSWQDRKPLIVKVLYGRSTECNLLPVMALQCLSIGTPDRTSITGIVFGRTFVERLNGWPLDFVGYAGVIHHNERGLQPDGWQFDVYMKAYFHGFPWSDRVRTRLGFGAGVSWATRVPYVEARDQGARDRTTSKLLNYLDPSIDVSVGDVIGSRRWADTFFGLGVSHRSGVFGASQLLGNVEGGSNYIYTYLETMF
ncbi:MAG: MipA/OmpV family protein [Betaproteobacteria bacterium]|jgi:outer membrane protein